jgi:hypothetical protein
MGLMGLEADGVIEEAGVAQDGRFCWDRGRAA